MIRTLRGGGGLPKMAHREGGISAAGVRLSADPLCKGGTRGLRRGRGDWCRLSAKKCARRTASVRLLMALQSLDQENGPYTSAVGELAGGGSLSVLRMRDLANA